MDREEIAQKIEDALKKIIETKEQFDRDKNKSTNTTTRDIFLKNAKFDEARGLDNSRNELIPVAVNLTITASDLRTKQVNKVYTMSDENRFDLLNTIKDSSEYLINALKDAYHEFNIVLDMVKKAKAEENFALEKRYPRELAEAREKVSKYEQESLVFADRILEISNAISKMLKNPVLEFYPPYSKDNELKIFEITNNATKYKMLFPIRNYLKKHDTLIQDVGDSNFFKENARKHNNDADYRHFEKDEKQYKKELENESEKVISLIEEAVKSGLLDEEELAEVKKIREKAQACLEEFGTPARGSE